VKQSVNDFTNQINRERPGIPTYLRLELFIQENGVVVSVMATVSKLGLMVPNI